MSRFRFLDQIFVEVFASRIAIHIFEGPGVAEILRKFTEATGRQPFPAAPWFFGPWCQTGHADLVPFEEEQLILDTLQEANALPLAVETHMRRLPGGGH